jgi:hypothetical protein
VVEMQEAGMGVGAAMAAVEVVVVEVVAAAGNDSQLTLDKKLSLLEICAR